MRIAKFAKRKESAKIFHHRNAEEEEKEKGMILAWIIRVVIMW
jgi:hypothetical protein